MTDQPPVQPQGQPPAEGKDWTTTLILSLLLGGLGVDRFYPSGRWTLLSPRTQNR